MISCSGLICNAWYCIALPALPCVQVTKLVLEAHLWEKTEIAIPPLSFFHPRKEKDYQVSGPWIMCRGVREIPRETGAVSSGVWEEHREGWARQGS